MGDASLGRDVREPCPFYADLRDHSRLRPNQSQCDRDRNLSLAAGRGCFVQNANTVVGLGSRMKKRAGPPVQFKGR